MQSVMIVSMDNNSVSLDFSSVYFLSLVNRKTVTLFLCIALYKVHVEVLLTGLIHSFLSLISVIICLSNDPLST